MIRQESINRMDGDYERNEYLFEWRWKDQRLTVRSASWRVAP